MCRMSPTCRSWSTLHPALCPGKMTYMVYNHQWTPCSLESIWLQSVTNKEIREKKKREIWVFIPPALSLRSLATSLVGRTQVLKGLQLFSVGKKKKKTWITRPWQMSDPSPSWTQRYVFHKKKFLMWPFYTRDFLSNRNGIHSLIRSLGRHKKTTSTCGYCFVTSFSVHTSALWRVPYDQLIEKEEKKKPRARFIDRSVY